MALLRHGFVALMHPSCPLSCQAQCARIANRAQTVSDDRFVAKSQLRILANSAYAVQRDAGDFEHVETGYSFSIIRCERQIYLNFSLRMIRRGGKRLSIFYAAVEDDPLDSGGRVIEGGECGAVKGEDGQRRRLTFLGQQAWCEKCESTGTIVAAPGSPDKKRLYDRSRARQQALGGDLVLCKCTHHPRIVPVYGRKWKIIQDNESTGHAAGPITAVGTMAMAVAYDDRFILKDADGRALAYTAYALRRHTGTFEYGETDGRGRTHLLSSVAAAETIHVFLAG